MALYVDLEQVDVDIRDCSVQRHQVNIKNLGSVKVPVSSRDFGSQLEKRVKVWARRHGESCPADFVAHSGFYDLDILKS